MAMLLAWFSPGKDKTASFQAAADDDKTKIFSAHIEQVDPPSSVSPLIWSFSSPGAESDMLNLRYCRWQQLIATEMKKWVKIWWNLEKLDMKLNPKCAPVEHFWCQRSTAAFLSSSEVKKKTKKREFRCCWRRKILRAHQGLKNSWKASCLLSSQLKEDDTDARFRKRE